MAINAVDVRYGSPTAPMHGRLFRDASLPGPRPCVLVFPEGFGISDHTFRQAERIAALGYVALACDLFGGGYFHNGPLPETRRRVDEILARPKGLLQIGRSALDYAVSLPQVDATRVAAAGYCLGATIAMEMAIANSPIVAAAGFHPSFAGLSLSDIEGFSCPLHLFIGAEDYATMPPARADLEAALHGKGNPWRLTIYGSVKHSFTNNDCQGMGDKVAYDADADHHSFKAMAELLAQAFA